MKLELKHLAGYLPYGLQIEPLYQSMGHMGGFQNKTLDIGVLEKYEIEDIKPILRPLSDLITHSEFTDKYHYYFDEKEGFMVKRRNETYARIDELEYLYKHHFDIHGLIENGLAINKNTIK